jgi:hypothetical protein
MHWDLYSFLFHIRAPTCFENYIPSSGNIRVHSELLLCWSDWVVGHLVCSRMIYVTACRVFIHTYIAYSSSVRQETPPPPRTLCNPKFHYPIHKIPPPVRTLSQINPVHAHHPTFWRYILILSSYLRLGLPSGLFSSGFPITNLYDPLLSPIHANCTAHLFFKLRHVVYIFTKALYKANKYLPPTYFDVSQTTAIHRPTQHCATSFGLHNHPALIYLFIYLFIHPSIHPSI